MLATITLASILTFQKPPPTVIELACPFKSVDTPVVAGFPSRGFLFGHWFRSGIGHTGDAFAKPFVWAGGEQIALPLAGSEVAHLWCGDEKGVYGSINTDGDYYPCKWTPDPIAGWKKAKLALIEKKGGSVHHVDKSGRLYIAGDESLRVWESGVTSQETRGKFDLIGVDSKGRWYGNTYSKYGLGSSRLGERATMRQGIATTSLHPAGYDESSITRVNQHGIAVGSARVDTRWEAVMWEDRVMRALASPKKGHAEAVAVNDRGDVVYCWSDGGMKTRLRMAGKTIDITPKILGVQSLLPVAIDDVGDVAFIGGTVRGPRILIVLR